MTICECLIYEFQLGYNAAIATQNICASKGQGVVSYITAKRWFNRFRDGDFSLRNI
jgi:hypothetical protein